MKKIKFIFPLLIIFTFIIQSCKKDDIEDSETNNSFTVKVDGEIADNKIFTYNTIGIDGEMGIQVTNNDNSLIKLKIKVISLEGNGAGLQLCFNSCTASIIEGYEDFKSLAAGETTTKLQTHIVNASPGNQNSIVKLRITQVDENNNNLLDGKVVDFTYNYVAP